MSDKKVRRTIKSILNENRNSLEPNTFQLTRYRFTSEEEIFDFFTGMLDIPPIAIEHMHVPFPPLNLMIPESTLNIAYEKVSQYFLDVLSIFSSFDSIRSSIYPEYLKNQFLFHLRQWNITEDVMRKQQLLFVVEPYNPINRDFLIWIGRADLVNQYINLLIRAFKETPNIDRKLKGKPKFRLFVDNKEIEITG